jgi:hypothetical protein
MPNTPHFTVPFVRVDRSAFCRNENIINRAGILMLKKHLVIIVFAFWLLIISFLMLLAGRFDLALFFILGFIGFLVIVQIIELRYVRPGSFLYVRFLVVAGIILVVTIIFQKVLETLGLEIIIG